MISYRDYNILISKLVCNRLEKEDIRNLVELFGEFENLLDEADLEDFYGTEGWRRRFGWVD